MFRTYAVIAAVLASAGTAQAADQIVVVTAGKSPRIVRAELFRAAYTVCADSLDPLASQTLGDCARASFDDALQRFHDLRRSRDLPARSLAPR